MIESLVQKYGKQLISELISMAVINRKINQDYTRKLLIKHGVIKRSTKVIRGRVYINKTYGYVNNVWTNLGYDSYTVDIRNGRNKIIIHFIFTDKDLPHIMEVLNDGVD